MGQIEHKSAIIGAENHDTDTARAAAEVQASVIVARRFPRDESHSMTKVMQACQRKKLAEQSAYSYSRGGADVSGPSIRLAEEVARCWGNINYGIREVSRDATETLYEVFCWDLESNIRVSRTFSQAHVRHTKQGAKQLTDSRDIYEIVASNAARRLRAVILEVLPNYIVEEALEECEKTLKKDQQGADKNQIVKAMVERFAEFKVTEEMIVKRIGRNLEAITQKQIIDLRKVYQSLADGMSSTKDWFEVQESVTSPREEFEKQQSEKQKEG
jgi:hypothetical protein